MCGVVVGGAMPTWPAHATSSSDAGQPVGPAARTDKGEHTDCKDVFRMFAEKHKGKELMKRKQLLEVSGWRQVERERDVVCMRACVSLCVCLYQPHVCAPPTRVDMSPPPMFHNTTLHRHATLWDTTQLKPTCERSPSGTTVTRPCLRSRWKISSSLCNHNDARQPRNCECPTLGQLDPAMFITQSVHMTLRWLVLLCRLLDACWYDHATDGWHTV